MRLIRRIRITGFRSLQAVELDSLGHLTALVGKNSSGKSNVLRALNLFFNGAVEPSQSLDFLRDHYGQFPRHKKKKRIGISVDFTLPPNFKLRPGLKHLGILGDTFTISREWELDPRREPFDRFRVDQATEIPDDPDSIARQFIGLISYRYLGNRTIPANVLRDESQAIAHSLFIRMKGRKEPEQLLQSLTAAGRRLLRPASETLERAGAPIREPLIATPASLGEMLTMSGFQALGAGDVPIADEDWGQGHQAFFLYQLLHALDTNYGRFYGWRQATIWGIEEPESALHRDLETHLAGSFRTWALDDPSKLQIIETTHSPISTMAADAGFWVDLEGPRSSITPLSISDLSRRAETQGVSGWVHPVLSFPWSPVVLVEGDIDVAALSHAAEIGGFEHLRFLSLPKLDTRIHKGGVASITSYLSRNKKLIDNRPKASPLVVLLDWDVPDQDLKKARGAYGDCGSRRVLRMNDAYCNTLMGADFKGIERFYPPRLALESHTAGRMIIGIADNHPYTVSQSELKKGKKHLLEGLRSTISKSELRPLLSVLLDVERAVRGKYVQLELLPDPVEANEDQ